MGNIYWCSSASPAKQAPKFTKLMSIAQNGTSRLRVSGPSDDNLVGCDVSA